MLLPLFEWMEQVGVFEASIYIGPVMNIVHLLSMVVFIGANVVVDLRLLGAGLTRLPAAVVMRDAAPWFWGGLAGLVATGVPAMMAVATELYGNSVFWVKMAALGAGLALAVAVRGRVGPLESGAVTVASRCVGALSIVLWLVVAALARLVMIIPGDTFEWLVG